MYASNLGHRLIEASAWAKKPQRSGGDCWGYSLKHSRGGVMPPLGIMLQCSNASAAIKQFVFTWRNDKTPYSRL